MNIKFDPPETGISTVDLWNRLASGAEDTDCSLILLSEGGESEASIDGSMGAIAYALASCMLKSKDLADTILLANMFYTLNDGDNG